MDTEANALEHDGAHGASASPNAKRVLVVEDDEHMRRLIALTLHQCGFDVVEAGDGVDLLGWLGASLWRPSDHGVDLVISDVNLPDMTAIEVMAALRTHDSTVPVILVTASDDRDLHEQAYDLGASAVLVKPFDMNDLGALAKSLGSHKVRGNRTFRRTAMVG